MEKSVLDIAEFLNDNEDLPQELRERIEAFVQRLRDRRNALSLVKEVRRNV